MTNPAKPGQALTRYALASLAGHLSWEILQLPLYALWYDSSASQMVFAVVHCTLGDLLIAASTLLAALLLFGRTWPQDRSELRKIAIVAIVLGVAYAVYSEWLNVNVRGTWSYSIWMPRLPPLGTGLSPLLQWIVVPSLAFRWMLRGMKP